MIRKMIYLLIFNSIFTLAGCLRDEGAETIVFERENTRLDIPSEHITKYDISWISEISGLDSSKNSIRIHFTINNYLMSKADIYSLRGIITILTQDEKESIEENSKYEIANMVNKKGYFSNAIFKPDEKTGFYKVYKTEKIKSHWSVLSQSPEKLKRSNSGRDWIAVCHLNSFHKKEVCTSSFIYKNMLIEVTGNSDFLVHYFTTIRRVEEIISSWIVI